MSSTHDLVSTKKTLEEIKQEMLHLQSEMQRLGHELLTIKEAISSTDNMDDLRKRIQGTS